MTSQPKQPSWPNNATFWRDKRVVVTGGAGFLGSFIVEKLQARSAAEVFAPRIEDDARMAWLVPQRNRRM